MLKLGNISEFAKEEDRIAAVSSEGTLFYHDLQRAIQAIRWLISETVPSVKAPILLIGDKENLFLAGIYAAVMSGYPYVAVSSSFPEQRIHEIHDICGACMVINFSTVDFLRFDRCWYGREAVEQAIKEQRTVTDGIYQWKDEELFAVFFTSGSTGQPKGVKITYRNICINIKRRMYTAAKHHHYAPNQQPVILNFSSYGFIASLTMLFYDVCLMGAKLYAVSRQQLSDYKTLLPYIYDVDPTQFTCTPSFLDICLRNSGFCQANMPSLQVVYCGGGPMSVSIARRFRERFGCTLLNLYGITEATSLIIYYPTDELDSDAEGFVPSGRCLPDAEAFIADEDGNPLPDGTAGELCLMSPSICAGYYHSDKDPFFEGVNGWRGFRTGDLFRKENGLYYYLGRIDRMVKIGSYRVDLFDVENNLLSIPEVKACAVVPCKRDGDVRLLTAFVVPEDGVRAGLLTTAKIKKQLRSKVQPYAVPQVVTYLDALPLNFNNKPDTILMETMAEQAAFGL